MTLPLTKLRLDKWLWAARFYKTRSLATHCIDKGKARVNGNIVKPAYELRVGDAVSVLNDASTRHFEVLALSDVRRGAPEASALYAETAESIAARLALAENKKHQPEPTALLHGRPTKRQRRALDSVNSTY